MNVRALAFGMIVAAATATVAAVAAAAPPIVVDGVAYHVVIRPLSFADCEDAGAQLSGSEVARAHIEYRFAAVVDPSDHHQRLLAASVDPDSTYVEIPQITWPNMSDADHEAVERLIDEIKVHERGHIAIGLAAASDATQLHHVIVPNGGDVPAERAIAHQFDVRQDDYDALTSHGIHQSRAPADLAGHDIRLICHES